MLFGCRGNAVGRCSERLENPRTRVRESGTWVSSTRRRASPSEIAENLGCSEATVVRTRRRWREHREPGLIDRREDNHGHIKADEDYVSTLWWLLGRSPRQHGFRRPTWTLRLIAKAMEQHTGTCLSGSRLSRLLRSMAVRWGRPKPGPAPCISVQTRRKREKQVNALIDTLPGDEVVVWQDEVNIDLNPRMGHDWIRRGEQREIPTPGQNVKRYIAAAMDAHTKRLVWLQGARKSSPLFIKMLERLQER